MCQTTELQNTWKTNEQTSLIKLIEELDKSTVIVGTSNTPFSAIDRPIRWKISRNIELTNTISQQGLIDIYRLLHTTAQYTLFSSAHGTFLYIDYNLGCKTNFNKFRRIEIIYSILSDHNRIKLEISNRKQENL